MIYLDFDDLLHVAAHVLPRVEVRDMGLLQAACARPAMTVYGKDAYSTVHDKAATLLHSLATNHALVDGNKRLALAGTFAFYGINGWRLILSNDEAYQLVMSVAEGTLRDVPAIAERLRRGVEPRPT